MLPHWIWLIFIAIYGCCIGSFLNVVIYRLPEEQSLIRPGSRCPSCSHALAWYDNVPVLGWLWLRGRCRYCKAPISVQYPIVEAAMGLMFAGLYAVYYMTSMRPGFWQPGLGATWPALVMHLLLLAGLFSATVIDAKLFIIPRQIPWTLTLIALIGLPGSVWLGWMPSVPGPVPVATPTGVTTAIGGLVGLGLAVLLLRLKVLPLSFADYEQAYQAHRVQHKQAVGGTGGAGGAEADGGEKEKDEDWFHYPHARREVLKELLFLLFPIVGLVGGYLFGPTQAVTWPGWVGVLGGVAFGYLAGAGLIWGTRVLGTLAFGKEAMGLGDVHLLAAIGAVLGPSETVPIFFIAPFFGLVAAVLMLGASAVLRKRFQPIPYGPYLAGAAVVVMVWHEPIMGFCQPLMRIFDIFIPV